MHHPHDQWFEENTGDMYTSQEIMDIYEEWQRHTEARGARAGMARLLMHQLTHRFGELSPEIEERIQQASVGTLTIWAERVATAQSVEDVVHEEREHADALQQVQAIYEEWQQHHRAEGERAGLARLLMHLLAQRFGEVPAEVEARIRQASADTLTRWAERVLTAESIEDVLA